VSETANVALGIDVGGTGIKGALVDLDTGSLVSERFRLDTPRPAVPSDVADTIVAVADHFDFDGPVGVAFPGVVLDGVVHTAANLHPDWVGLSLQELIGPRLRGRSVYLNDADAAGLAEAHFGAAKGTTGVVVVVTLGTGLGVALISDGRLVPNSELGHLIVDGQDAELYAAASGRKRNDLSWEEWAGHAEHYLEYLESLTWPKLFVLGGGITKNPEKWLHYLHPRTPIVLATHINNAGIIGAADATRKHAPVE
jgi:polyphosphate glucokinase